MKKSYKPKKSEGGKAGLVEDGDYRLRLESDKWVKTNAGDGHFLEVEFVSDDKAAGKKHFWHRFNLDNPSEKAVEISEEQLENLLFCLGSDGIKFDKKPTLKPLFGGIVMAHIVKEEVTKKEAKKGMKPKNVIKYFFEVDEDKGSGKKGKGKGKKGKKKDDPF